MSLDAKSSCWKLATNKPELSAFSMSSEDMAEIGADTLYSTITPTARLVFALDMDVIAAVAPGASTVLTTAPKKASCTG